MSVQDHYGIYPAQVMAKRDSIRNCYFVRQEVLGACIIYYITEHTHTRSIGHVFPDPRKFLKPQIAPKPTDTLVMQPCEEVSPTNNPWEERH